MDRAPRVFYSPTWSPNGRAIAYESTRKGVWISTWDGKTEQIVGNEEAARLLKREYRAPYKHPSKV